MIYFGDFLVREGGLRWRTANRACCSIPINSAQSTPSKRPLPQRSACIVAGEWQTTAPIAVSCSLEPPYVVEPGTNVDCASCQGFASLQAPSLGSGDAGRAHETSAQVLEADNNEMWDRLHSKAEILKGVRFEAKLRWLGGSQ